MPAGTHGDGDTGNWNGKGRAVRDMSNRITRDVDTRDRDTRNRDTKNRDGREEDTRSTDSGNGDGRQGGTKGPRACGAGLRQAGCPAATRGRQQPEVPRTRQPNARHGCCTQ